ncbi:MAG: tannase/feruloyl esterase family alpha/beta hydrolase [Acidobacteriota bacterium]
MRHSTPSTPLLALLGVSLSFGGGVLAGTCEEMTRFTLPGYDIVINEARTVPEGPLPPGRFGAGYQGVIPQHCRVDGEIDKREGRDGKPYAIGFAVAMPKDWNGRFLFQGGGGLNGTVANPVGLQSAGAPALARGFAVVSTDSGHKAREGMAFDGSFFADQEATLNFLYKAIGKTTVVAKAMVREYYSKPIGHAYYVGCSTGGREGMIMSQRFPEYYDGIVSGAPAMRTNVSNLATRWVRVSLNQAAPLDASGQPVVGGGLPESDQKLLVDAFLRACDEKDGIKDGMVFDVEGCDFDPASLMCQGEKTDECLSEEQVKALHQGMAGPIDSRGHPVYSGFPYDTGIIAKPPASFIPGLLVMSGSVLGPPTRETTLDIDQASIAADTAQAEVGNTFKWTNLSTFSGHGGKLIFYHGMSDPWFSALDTMTYYRNLVRDNGGADQVADWSRLFLVPGMGHCGGGAQTLDRFDMLDAIVKWVEDGEAPGSVVATGRAYPDRSRPLCAYPKHAQYTGQGNSEDAGNFECRQ